MITPLSVAAPHEVSDEVTHLHLTIRSHSADERDAVRVCLPGADQRGGTPAQDGRPVTLQPRCGRELFELMAGGES
jgi:hypothetical protein